MPGDEAAAAGQSSARPGQTGLIQPHREVIPAWWENTLEPIQRYPSSRTHRQRRHGGAADHTEAARRPADNSQGAAKETADST